MTRIQNRIAKSMLRLMEPADRPRLTGAVGTQQSLVELNRPVASAPRQA